MTAPRPQTNRAQPDYRREVVGIFKDPMSLERAISALSSAGWDRAEMSLLGQRSALAPDRPASAVADDPDAPHKQIVSDTDERQGRTLAASMAGVAAAFAASGATIATGGTALAAIVGAAVAGGGVTAAGDLVGTLFKKRITDSMAEQIDRGGILLWVLLRAPEEEARATAIMTEKGAVEVHAHDRT